MAYRESEVKNEKCFLKKPGRGRLSLHKNTSWYLEKTDSGFGLSIVKLL
jgi:hypothetical protein